MSRTPLTLPDFPWDSLAPFGERARAHPEGMIDLSVGSPVDASPLVVREALAAATDAHAYPQTMGSPALREAIIEWFSRRRGVIGLAVENVLPTIGSKELIALMPLFLGLGRGDVVVHPAVAYPTYALGAALAGASVVASDHPTDWPENTRLIWLNSPGNPDGRVLSTTELRLAVARARELGAVIVGDECYAELNWQGDHATTSILDPAVTGGHDRGVLAVYSLSKQSNLAGYRAGIVAGCAEVIAELLAVRKHVGLIPPAPVQEAMMVALGDEVHVAEQRELYRARRSRLLPAVQDAGYRVDHSEAGLYLWATRGQDSWDSVARWAELGILVAPGAFYGERPARHIRIALTATDSAIKAAIDRLSL
ncbi:MAG: succinyldiaminopimelate transaminase [Rhodoglobus sp.]